MTITKNMLLYFIRNMKVADLPEVMNDLVENFYRLVEWDKNMHIAALEGREVQVLISQCRLVLQQE